MYKPQFLFNAIRITLPIILLFALLVAANYDEAIMAQVDNIQKEVLLVLTSIKVKTCSDKIRPWTLIISRHPTLISWTCFPILPSHQPMLFICELSLGCEARMYWWERGWRWHYHDKNNLALKSKRCFIIDNECLNCPQVNMYILLNEFFHRRLYFYI